MVLLGGITCFSGALLGPPSLCVKSSTKPRNPEVPPLRSILARFKDCRLPPYGAGGLRICRTRADPGGDQPSHRSGPRTCGGAHQVCSEPWCSCPLRSNLPSRGATRIFQSPPPVPPDASLPSRGTRGEDVESPPAFGAVLPFMREPSRTMGERGYLGRPPPLAAWACRGWGLPAPRLLPLCGWGASGVQKTPFDSFLHWELLY